MNIYASKFQNFTRDNIILHNCLIAKMLHLNFPNIQQRHHFLTMLVNCALPCKNFNRLSFLSLKTVPKVVWKYNSVTSLQTKDSSIHNRMDGYKSPLAPKKLYSKIKPDLFITLMTHLLRAWLLDVILYQGNNACIYFVNMNVLKFS